MPIIKGVAINEKIRDREIRLIGAEGEQIGIVSGQEGQRLAKESGLDLVKIAPKATPPVCKIMDYGKYKFDLAKKEKEARRKQKTVNLKEVRFSASIEEHDFNTKLRSAERFLKAGDKVKVSVMFRGREMMHTQNGRKLLDKASEILSEFGDVEGRPRFEGRHLVIMVLPK